MKLFFESYEYLTEEDLLEASAKTDFRDKFGQKSLDNFDKARQRLKNKGMSVDYGQYLKMSQDELDNLILSLYDDKKDAQKKRVLQGKDKEIRGKYNYIGEYGGFKIYEPLDYIASMDLGVNTGWCTTGRYGHAGHPEYTPSEEDAMSHFKDYTGRGIRLIYFLNPKTMYGEWALALYPKILSVKEFIGNNYIIKTNFELFDANDDSNYSGIQKLPLDKLNVEIVLDTAKAKNGLVISEDGVLIKVDPKLKSILESISLPDGITKIGDRAFFDFSSLKSISIPNSVTEIGVCAFSGCGSLKSISIPNSVTKIGRDAFSYCESLESIIIPNSVTKIGESAFFGYSALKSVSLPKRFLDDETLDYLGLDWLDKSKIKFT